LVGCVIPAMHFGEKRGSSWMLKSAPA
jgi:hypothetical protein